MGSRAERDELFAALMHLRRAQRELPDSRDLVAVRQVIEDRLGSTVSQRFAARVLGTTHTALARWIASGDFAVVPTASGRLEVPVGLLAEQVERVQAERDRGRRHVLEPLALRARSRADQLDGERLLADVPASDDPHDRAGRRALAYHRALARDLCRADVDAARHTLWAWERRGRIDPHYAERWNAVLERPLVEIRRAISADTQEARDLRQSSPMAGLLTEPERRKIVATVR